MRKKEGIDLSPIYTITAFNLKKKRKKGKDWEAVERTRCLGYYHDFETAEKVVKANCMDINEAGYYSHVVIEQVEPSLYPVQALFNRWFYEWKRNKYVRCKAFDDPQPDVVSYVPIG